MDVLERFSPATRAWFTSAFAAPTEAQEQAWEAIATGRDTLVVAPTGSGKTLAAFLVALDQLATQPPPGDTAQPPPRDTTQPPRGDTARRCRVLYVSPLKALAVDVRRNLHTPLTGIRGAAQRLGLPGPDVRVAIRSGDTPAADRRSFARRPPDICITTPESLFLLLTSAAREALRGVETVIVDEVHAVAGTKRGAHLAVSLERLDALLDAPARRIGLSATVRPLEEMARFLGGSRDVRIVAPPAPTALDLKVVVPVPDMAAPGESAEPTASAPMGGEMEGATDGAQRRTSLWPAIDQRIAELIRAHRSTIVFANSRRLAERLTARLNDIAAATGAEGAEPMARAHHGSVSREQRVRVESELKAGRLPAVVATSSLELGIDMGAVDLVIQVEAPPSVAAGLQRVGRSGHQVGAVSRGVLFPKYRGDLVEVTVVAERMRSGAIEALAYPRNPLDVLAQQVVAMVAMDDWQVQDIATVVRRAAPFAGLPTSSFEAVLDMLAGRYPSDEFAALRPRLVWDRVAHTLTARSGAQRLAVTSGGTIPDRGLFGVFLPGGDSGRSAGGGSGGSAEDGSGAEGSRGHIGERGGRRVGELDEEMVYESRVGQVITLGSSSWRIAEITADRVLVSPAPGVGGTLPFWHGDAPGRPVELGRALGGLLRELAALEDAPARSRLRAAGLDELAADNLLAYLAEQRSATGHLPDDRTLVIERFRDELGDWRLAVHSPFGGRVNAPWALALGARLRERHQIDVQAMHADDGIVLRLPDTEDPPPAAAAVFGPDEVEAIVRAEVAGSALFASRFRECAGRALLLPRRDPRRRTPLWQQRQRAAQLLGAAARYPDFPILLETMRECLCDVFDVPGLVELMRDVAARRVRIVEVETSAPSPFARSLLFRYVGTFMYEGDAPLAERRAQALSLDPTLLAELLGQADLRELLDTDVIVEVERELQWLTPARAARSVQDVHDLLRIVGDLTTAEALERGASTTPLAELEAARRAIRVRIAGEERWLAAEDASRVRDALGVPLPPGVPDAMATPVRDPIEDLVSRFARTHPPFVSGDVARRLGLGSAVVDAALGRLAAAGRMVSGEFRPAGHGLEWCDPDVLRRLRRRSLARLRREVEPAPVEALARFLPAWQGAGQTGSGRGTDGVLRAVEQLQGAVLPASAWERLVLPARVVDYTPGLLDELTTSGEVLWAGHGALTGNDGWVSLHLADAAPLLLPSYAEEPATASDEYGGNQHDASRERVLDVLAGGGALFFRALSDRVGSTDDQALLATLWALVWSGRVTNDTLGPLRTLLAGSRTTRPRSRSDRSTPRSRSGRRRSLGRPAMPSRTGPPAAAGRWSLLPEPETDPTRRATALAEVLLERYGVLTRATVAGAVAAGGRGGFAGIYPVLRALEESGRARRGYFVEGLGAAQFAVPGAVDRMRAHVRDPAHPTAMVLAATDPANPFGGALPWPDRPEASDGEASDGEASGSQGQGGHRRHRPGRKAGALVVCVDGRLVLYLERGGRTLLSWSREPEPLARAVDALAGHVRAGRTGTLTVQTINGGAALASPVGDALQAAGFVAMPRGLRLRG